MKSRIRDRIARIFYPLGSIRRVLRGPAAGMQYVVSPAMGVTYGLGTHRAAPRDFSRHVRPGSVVFDVGANRGQSALLFAKLVGGTGLVVSLEPAPREFETLCRNVALNSGARIRLIQAAASDTDGTAAFLYSAVRNTQGKLNNVEAGYALEEVQTISVPTVTLDSLLKEIPPPDFLKVDVEGAGSAVFRGAVRMLTEVRPIIYIELHGREEQEGVRDEVQSRGYELRTGDGSVVADPTAGWFSPLWCFPRP